MDQSLDEFIKQRKIRHPMRGGGVAGRGKRGVAGPRRGLSSPRRGRGGNLGGVQNRRPQQMKVQNRPGAGRQQSFRGHPMNMQYQQRRQVPQRSQLFNPLALRRGGGGVMKRQAPFAQTRPAAVAQAVNKTPTKLYISNLDFGVNDRDIKELFSEFGAIKSSSVNFSSTGRSLGTAEVNYINRNSAIMAIKKYNNVTLDGRPMKLEVTGPNQSQTSPRKSVTQRLTLVQNKTRGASRGRGVVKRGAAANALKKAKATLKRGGAVGLRGKGRGGRGRGKSAPAPTAAQLDADLAAYSTSKD